MPNVTSVWDFSPGETLTAAKLDDVNCGIHVFSGTATRDAAYGGSGERTLAEGEFAYLADSNTTQFFDGSSWQSVGGLAVVKAETAFTTASSITADGVFTSAFTNYRLVLNYTTSTTGTVRIRLRTGGSSLSTTTYNGQRIDANSTTVGAGRSASATEFLIGYDSNGSFNSTCEGLICNPQVATPTTFLFHNAVSSAALTTPIWMSSFGNNSNATSYDGIEIYPGSGTMTGTYTIYGLAK